MDSLVNLQVFSPSNATVEAKVIEDLDVGWEPLRKLTPDLGAYLNEASLKLMSSLL